jgi:hypothetical protein
LAIVSCVVKVLLATMKSVSAGRRARGPSDVVAVDVRDEVHREARIGERRQRRDRHLRPEVAAADADVDDVAERPRRVAGARPHRLGEGEHRLAPGVHLVGERRRARRRAQGRCAARRGPR